MHNYLQSTREQEEEDKDTSSSIELVGLAPRSHRPAHPP